VVSNLAWLEVGVGPLPEAEWIPWSADVILNDQRIATLQWGGAQNPQYLVNGEVQPPYGPYCVSFPSRYVKFAAHAGAPADNEIQFLIRDIGAEPSGLQPDFVGAAVLTLNIEAMAPIVLVHGIAPFGNGANWWGHGFTAQLNAAHFPYAIAREPGVNGMNPGGIEFTGATLMDVIPALAREFGAKKVHIVAHSKGGLWSRYFLSGPNSPYPGAGEEFTENSLGVLSLTTLDTPHYGSRVAYAGSALTSDGFLRGLRELSIATTITVPGTLDFLSSINPQVADLTPEAVGEFNRAYPSPPWRFRDADGAEIVTAYRMVAADADNGNKGYVDSADVAGMDFPFEVLGVVTPFANFMYRYLGDEVSELQVNPFGITSPTFQQNDLVVTSNSARYLGIGPGSFVEILPNTKKNHTSVGYSSVAGVPALGSGVLSEIRQIQPLN